MTALTPSATCERDAEMPTAWHVSTTWTASGAELDRPDGIGFLLPNRSVAERLCAAINAGAVFAEPRIARDINGKTYVAASSRVLGKRANADLRRLGF